MVDIKLLHVPTSHKITTLTATKEYFWIMAVSNDISAGDPDLHNGTANLL